MKNIEQSVKLKAELDSLRPLKKEDELRIMQKFRLDWNYHSNNIEGNTLTYGETKALLLHNITAQGKPLRDHIEVTGHNEALLWITDVVKGERPLTETFIRELHELILKEPYEVDAITPEGQPTKKTVQIGKYKTTPNHVKTKTGEIFRFAKPEETKAEMDDLIAWYRKKVDEKDVNPILLASEFHYKFIRIHPFDDGNGRTARIIMNFILMKFGYPPAIIKTEDKENYYGVLRQADGGKLEPFIEYIAQNLNHSLEIMIKGAKGESIEEPDDFGKEIVMLEQQLKSIGDTIKISKNVNSIIDIYDNSFTSVFEKYQKKGQLFKKLYLKSEFRISINGVYNNIISLEKALEKRRLKINSRTNTFGVSFLYKSLKQSHLSDFDYLSSITFNFKLGGYVVKNRAGAKIEKFYGEYMTTEEIELIIDSEVRKHKQVIETKIKQIKPKKK